jgi:hypothetical protein
MPHSRHQDPHSTPKPRTFDDRSQEPPPRRRGGQELPDDVQDRPEQNAGYDEAVRSGPAGERQDDLGVESLPGEGRNDVTIVNPDDEAAGPLLDIDDRAERGALADTRRREHRR